MIIEEYNVELLDMKTVPGKSSPELKTEATNKHKPTITDSNTAATEVPAIGKKHKKGNKKGK